MPIVNETPSVETHWNHLQLRPYPDDHFSLGVEASRNKTYIFRIEETR